ncbi:MAG: histidinol-phosphatase HisJ family protein [Lachnospiraceae bacterium]|nr:histidinol-phosphatase HisJ family protein [Lachnospiraceae bacterium]
MPITADFHMHSSFSGDSDAPMEAMIQKGIELGLTHMCFTEHNDFDFPVCEETPEGTFELNVDAYLYDLLKYREKYKDKINILFGIELGLQPQVMRQNSILAKSYDFDFIIGSSHICNKKDPYYPPFYEGRSEEEAYREYFESILENIKKFSNFDVYGHLDYVVRYGPNKDANYSYAKYRDILDLVLELLIDKGKGLEINTGGVKSGLKELHPCTDILKRYRELGGEIITIGSDAHSPEVLTAHFDRATDVLKECGFKYYTIFEKRVAEFKKL